MNPIKKEAIDHYKRMIKWAGRKIREKDMAGRGIMRRAMLRAIGEDWSADYCSYCDNYNCFCIHDCPLGKDDKGGDNTECCNNLWNMMDDSATWGEWVVNAKLVLEYIKDNG